MSNISLQLGTVKWKLNRHLCPHKQNFFCIFKCFCCWVLLKLWKTFLVLEVWHKGGTVSFFFFKGEEISKLLQAIKRKMKSKTGTIFILSILQCQCEKERGKKGESLSLYVSWFWWVSHLNLCERFWFAIVAIFLWNPNLNFQIVMGINLVWFLEKRIPSRYEVKCLLLSKEFWIWTVKLEITNNTIIAYMALIPTIPPPWIMREN